MNSLVIGILTICVVGESVNGVKIEFFRNENFTDLYYESNSTAECNNMPDDKKDVNFNSIRTDTCVMVYFDPNCEVGTGSRQFDLDNTRGWRSPVRSFHICNEDIGGHQLKIDILNLDEYPERDVLESYRNVCTCINVPQHVQNRSYWSIDNYGNDFLAFYQPNCSENKWKAEHVPAGFMCHGSMCMHNYERFDYVTNTWYKIQSIGPDPNSKYFKTSCEQIPDNNQTVDSVRVEHETTMVFREDLQSLDANSGQVEQGINPLLTENPVVKNANIELKSNQENLYRRLEDSIEKLKEELNNFVLKLDEKLTKLDDKLSKFLSD